MKSPFVHLFLWCALAIAMLTGYWFWYSVVADKSAVVASLQNQIDVKTKISARIAATRSALAEIAGDESLVQSYFVPDTGVVSFIDDLEGRARAQSATMKVLSVSTGGNAKQSNLVLLATVTIDGTFDAVMRTVGSVEYAPYDISVSKLSVAKQDKNSWRASMELTVGSIPSAQAVTAVAASSTHP